MIESSSDLQTAIHKNKLLKLFVQINKSSSSPPSISSHPHPQPQPQPPVIIHTDQNLNQPSSSGSPSHLDISSSSQSQSLSSSSKNNSNNSNNSCLSSRGCFHIPKCHSHSRQKMRRCRMLRKLQHKLATFEQAALNHNLKNNPNLIPLQLSALFQGGHGGCPGGSNSSINRSVNNANNTTENTNENGLIPDHTPLHPYLRGIFIRDVSIPDAMVGKANDKLIKLWAVKNIGQHPWPTDLQLVHISGSIRPTERADIPAARPGGEVTFSQAIVLPDTPGDHMGVFRLQTRQGLRFGPQLWVNVIVLHELDSVD